MADASANHVFLPWVQPGVAAVLPAAATERLAADQAAAITLPLTLTINSDSVQKTVRLYGPGDVTGIDPQQVVRLEPSHRSTDFEPNYFPAIEFDRPDFPWLLTPARPDAQARLRPWLVLVVVRKQPGVTLAPAAGAPLPALSIAAPARPAVELPDLAESHLWAHAQVTGADPASLPGVLASDPTRNVSRLLCPRRLDPSAEYLACVVPAFEVGRKAGLGLPPAARDTLTPAWLSGARAPAAIQLPVYYSWEFRTGAGGDFEELARRLQPRELPPEVGKRAMDVSQPGFALSPPAAPDAPATVLGLEGALRVVGATPAPWPGTHRVSFQTALAPILNTPWEVATKAAAAGTAADPVLGPPIYGCWQAAVHEVPVAPPATWPPPFWLDELNLDPRTRVAAALGTAVIQKQQEELMAAAWERLGAIRTINQRLRQAQLSRAIGARYHAKLFNRLPDEVFARVVAPAQSRLPVKTAPAAAPPSVTPPPVPVAPIGPVAPVVPVRSTEPVAVPVLPVAVAQAAAVPPSTLLVQQLAGASVPTTALSATLRKITRPRGPLNRQYTAASAPGVNGILGLFGTAGVAPAAAPSSKGAVTIDQVTSQFARANADPAMGDITRVDYNRVVNTVHLGTLAGFVLTSTTTGNAFLDAARAHQKYLASVFPPPPMTLLPVLPRPPLSAAAVKAGALGSLDPATTVSQAVLPALSLGSPRSLTGDDLEPIMDAPSFPQPMYEALRDLSQDLLFPGLELVPPNTVQLLETNTRFVESFMVGLNAEMGRELLWRGYPTDQRGTYFQQFWDAVPEARPDLPPISAWGKRALGSNAAGAGTGAQLVLLIRGELLRRYPSAIIYAVPAGLLSTATDDQLHHPLFRGSLDPDVTFLGFHLTRDEALAGDGYFFVIQQHPTEPRFGLDDAPFSPSGDGGPIPALRTWNDLNWAHLAPTPEALAALSHVSVGKVSLAPTQQPPPVARWGRNAGHMAFITRQSLVRVAIHARRLIPAPAK